MTRLLNKVAIITGSSSGLGRAIAIEFAKQGAKIVCADFKPEARSQIPSETETSTHELIQKNGGEAIFQKTDVTVASEVEELVKATVEKWGKVDILVNNAGISLEAGTPPKRIHETDVSTFDTTISVNLRSIFLCCKSVISQMLTQSPDSNGDRGFVINLSSIYGLVGGRFIPSYAASKGGVTNLTRQIALDYAGDGIHINGICPGYTKTAIWAETSKTADANLISALHPLKGVGEVEWVVGAAVFLASADATWVTGTNLSVDGGFTAK